MRRLLPALALACTADPATPADTDPPADSDVVAVETGDTAPVDPGDTDPPPVHPGLVDVRWGPGRVVVIAGGAVGDQLGRGLASAGDYDGDGTEDLFVGAPGHDGLDAPDVGAAWVFRGADLLVAPGSLLIGEAGWAYAGADGWSGYDFGAWAAAYGSRTGGGLLAIAAPGTAADPWPGAILFQRGGPGIPGGLFPADGDPVRRRGHGLLPIDLDDDGSFELLVGEAPPEAKPNQLGLWTGFTERVDVATDVVPYDPDAPEPRTADVGDVDGQGGHDLLLGVPHPADGEARAWLVPASRLLAEIKVGAGELGVPITGDGLDAVGDLVVAAGDVDGDGRPDVGVAHVPRPGVHALAILSGATLDDAVDLHDALATVLLPRRTARPGGAPVGYGDVDGDGHGDLLVGVLDDGDPAADQLVVVDGAALTGGATIDLTDLALRPGPVVALGDLDGDGLGEVAVGEPARGGGRVTVLLPAR